MVLSTTDPQGHAGAMASPSVAARLKAAEQAINPLLEASRVLLHALAETPATLDADAIARWRRWLGQEIRLFTWLCSELRLRPEHVRCASYCLCSALDEAAMRTPWGKGKTTGVEWQDNSLASALGHDRQGGDRVFQLIDDAMRNQRENLDLIELYQNVLDLGFRGRYRFEAGGQKRLQVIREHVHDAVMTGGQSVNRVSEPRKRPRQTIDPWVRPVPVRRSRARFAGGLIVALLLGAGGYVAADRWVRTNEGLRASQLDVLARNLEQQLRDEVAAGNVELIRDSGRNALTLRFSGMFGPGEATVAPWGASVVASAGREIAAVTKGATLRVAGYADSTPISSTRQASNQVLSDVRARHVAQILVAAGVSAPRISVEGNGDADSLADNGTASGRARNRRVEVTISD
ncbi:type IVB secretion system protein IcmH/DotU [Burkholderia lata]|uniref:Outer membrane protein, OmpA/MotB family n=2 Tax=Burkholderia lata (strain ATCC 17760 / DSM 23089 / LMG 22485 / NCIMB 9086 / R18194 / 383) TaxID=482957 RepID=Q398K4_BURL3|nr:type IVB secretion system protein IcmH/DotU [Burkholderia lata]ABB11107.1 outer membrane protein, OmpA/MotB family [Burkholderia lata]KAF1034774.1 MAG: putative lipoprotein YiaD [Burkholderia lata]